jgi:hypothetical protein
MYDLDVIEKAITGVPDHCQVHRTAADPAQGFLALTCGSKLHGQI